MFGLSTLGIIHTAISLVALGAGAAALVRERRIRGDDALGRIYVWTTALTCLTGFGIFAHGGFGKAHALGVITLVVLAIAAVAERRQRPSVTSEAVATVAYSLTFFFHLVPGVTESTTRLPFGAPLVASPEAPVLQGVFGVLFLVFLAGAFLQVQQLRRGRAFAGLTG